VFVVLRTIPIVRNNVRLFNRSASERCLTQSCRSTCHEPWLDCFTRRVNHCYPGRMNLARIKDSRLAAVRDAVATSTVPAPVNTALLPGCGASAETQRGGWAERSVWCGTVTSGWLEDGF